MRIHLIVGLFATVPMLSIACTSEPADEEDDPVSQQQQAFIYIGYCETDIAGNLTGRCAYGSGLCQKRADTECPIGVPALHPSVAPSICGQVRFDVDRRCTTY
jgi:hypothetical protein